MYKYKIQKEETHISRVSFFRGAGRARTAVQTGDKLAFYMLIQWLVVGVAPDIGTQGYP